MKEFIDRSATNTGTPINRANLMAIQGFISQTVSFKNDGSIVESNSLGEKKTTVFNSNGTITETFVGEKTITKTTTFNNNGSISEVIS